MDQKMQGEPALICSEVGLVRCLGAAGVSVISGAESPGSSAFYSRYSRMNVFFSSYESEEFIQELIDLSRKLGYKPVLMSYDDRLIMNLSRNRTALNQYYHFLLPEEQMVENILDKMKFISLSDQYRLPVPASVRVSNTDHLKEAGQTLRKPYLIKPLYRHHWFHPDFIQTVGSYKKAYVCNSLTELKTQYEKISQINPNVVVQEYIDGPDDYMYDVNMYIDAEGTVKGSVVSRKMRVYPPTAGYGSYVVTVHEPEILRLSAEIAMKLELCGVVNVQFKKDGQTGEPKLIEIHTRTSIFDVLGIKSGVNIPALYYADMTGQPPPEIRESKLGVKYFHISRDLRYILKNRNSLRLPQVMKSYMGTKIIDGFSFTDPLPAIMELWWTLKHTVGKQNKKKETMQADESF